MKGFNTNRCCKRFAAALGIASTVLPVTFVAIPGARSPTSFDALAADRSGEHGEGDGLQPVPVGRPADVSVSSIIIKYREGVVTPSASVSDAKTATQSALMSVSEAVGITLTHHRVMGGNAQVVKLPERVTRERAEEIARRIAAQPGVLYAEPDAIMTIHFMPNDEKYLDQWHYYGPPADINAEPAWDISTGAGVVIAVVDTGYRPHADLEDQVLPGYDMISDTRRARDNDDGRDADATDPGDWAEPGDDCYDMDNMENNDSSWHGTHVAGIVAATTDNAEGVAGVAWQAKILPIRVLGRCARGTLSDIADGIRWAAGLEVPGAPENENPARVINLSLGVEADCGPTFGDAIASALQAGATLVISAGNSASDVRDVSPANCAGVITVAALDREGHYAFYSNFGELVEVSAPGGELFIDSDGTPIDEYGVLSTSNSGSTVPEDDTYEYKHGTSMAAPHVSGIAALLYSLHPRITPAQVSMAIMEGSREFVVECIGCGVGMADAFGTLLVGSLAPLLPARALLEASGAGP